MVDKLIVHNPEYDLVEHDGRMYIEQPESHLKRGKLYKAIISFVIIMFGLVLLLFPQIFLFLILASVFLTTFKRGLSAVKNEK